MWIDTTRADSSPKLKKVGEQELSRVGNTNSNGFNGNTIAVNAEPSIQRRELRYWWDRYYRMKEESELWRQISLSDNNAHPVPAKFHCQTSVTFLETTTRLASMVFIHSKDAFVAPAIDVTLPQVFLDGRLDHPTMTPSVPNIPCMIDDKTGREIYLDEVTLDPRLLSVSEAVHPSSWNCALTPLQRLYNAAKL